MSGLLSFKLLQSDLESILQENFFSPALNCFLYPNRISLSRNGLSSSVDALLAKTEVKLVLVKIHPPKLQFNEVSVVLQESCKSLL